MDALWERMESVGTDGECLAVVMVGTGCCVGTDGVCVDVIMVGTWMLCGSGWSCVHSIMVWDMDAERMESVWRLSWLGHGCSVGADEVCVDSVDVIMVGAWIPWKRMESVWTSSWLGHGCSVETDGTSSWLGHGCCGHPHGNQRQARRFRQANFAKYRKYRFVRGLDARAPTPSKKYATAATLSAAKPTKARKYPAGQRVRGASEQAIGARQELRLLQSTSCCPNPNSDKTERA